MPESLKELSDRATPGEIKQPDWGSDLRAGKTLIGMMSPVPEGNGKANGAYLCRLWNDHRSGQLHDATALAEAEARGYARGLEEAAKVATGHADAMEGNPPTSGERVASHIAVDILARRATTPAETGEST